MGSLLPGDKYRTSVSHAIVNHSLTFVDLETETHTQHIESYLESGKDEAQENEGLSKGIIS